MENLAQRIDRMIGSGVRAIAATGILYLGAVATSYSIVESNQTQVRKHTPEQAQIDFSHVYNPVKFWQENTELVQRGRNLREKNPEPMPKYGSFPTAG